jgi:hypothetical protein
MGGTRVDPEGADLSLPAHKLGLTGSGDVGAGMDLGHLDAMPLSVAPPVSSATYDLDILGPTDGYGLTMPETPQGEGNHRMLVGALNRSRADRIVEENVPREARAPTMKMPAKTVTGKADKTKQALNFAKALGFASGDETSPEYAQAAAKALAKMTKGMSVAKLLTAANKPKTQAEFQRLLEIEAAKMRQKPSTQPVRGLLATGI